jgi:hypothetical protein
MFDDDMPDRPNDHVFVATDPQESCMQGNENHLATASAPSRQRMHCRQENVAQIRDKCLGSRLLLSYMTK